MTTREECVKYNFVAHLMLRDRLQVSLLLLKAQPRVSDIFWELNLKLFKYDEKCFLFHAKSFFRSWDICNFALTFRLYRKTV